MPAGRIRRRIRADRGKTTGIQQVKAFLNSTVSNTSLSNLSSPSATEGLKNEHLPSPCSTRLLNPTNTALFVAFLRFMRRRLEHSLFRH